MLLTKQDDIELEADMRLLFQDIDDTTSFLNTLFKQRGSIVPVGKSDRLFCSILTKADSYKDLVSALTLSEAIFGLSQIGDAVVLQAKGESDSRLELSRSRPFHLGALRQRSAYFSWRRAKRHLRSVSSPSIDDAAQNFSIKAHLPGLTAAHEVDFNFQNDELLRGRISVLIGKNGTGKTQLLLALIRATLQQPSENLIPGALTKAQITPDITFNSLLVFSSVSSDRYPEAIPPWQGGIDYNYFSLVDRNKPPQDQLEDPLTASLIDIIRNDETFEAPDDSGRKITRVKLLQDALAAFTKPAEIHIPLKQPTPGTIRSTTVSGKKYASLSALSGEQRILETIQHVDWTCPPVIIKDGTPRHLSSGQTALLRFALQAIGAIQQGSLILMDEPETHLHPNFISVLVDILHTILEATGSCAIIATHSAYIVREVPRSRVRIINIKDDSPETTQPRLQTFGSSIDSISQFVFGDSEIRHLHEKLLEKWLSHEPTIEAILEKHGKTLNPESLSYIHSIMKNNQ
ncbi:hypothetical protein D7W81_30675 [Corallococcus aberystwythensis]|uniref:AAA+ ATPase domain-containing protein n=2 Tax=Corallococcus aberystwythensis TaxID=2316722 RepID=A0A3A8PMN3_9BACT|nr:hypothetical protein D7W81_30675 [Corallococcus aberystwythensis]